jgi:ADP-ribosylglycohydrolase
MLIDRAQGVMLGIAAGNLLGLRVEGWSRQRIAARYPSGIRDINPREIARRMDDDLAQSVELAEALLEEGDTTGLFAKRLITWSEVNGRGMGRTTRESIAQLSGGMEPPHAAYAVYRAKNDIAPNGGIMRCAPVAIYHRTQPELLARITADTCAVTHYSPLCQWSCVIANAAIAMLLGGREPNLRALLGTARADGCPDLLAAGRRAGVDTAVLQRATEGRAMPESTSWLANNQQAKGHTILTLQAGLWAAAAPASLGLEESLAAVVNAGGDTDTNGALAGAVLGARHGASAIPLHWTAYITQRERLTGLGQRLSDTGEGLTRKAAFLADGPASAGGGGEAADLRQPHGAAGHPAAPD